MNTDNSVSSAPVQMLEMAIAQHKAGLLQQAQAGYLAILQTDPAHAQANHNMGVLKVQMNQPVPALPYLFAALEAEPGCAQYWISYIDALFQAGLKEEAHQVLALARQQGLNSAEADELAVRMADQRKGRAAVMPQLRASQQDLSPPPESEQMACQQGLAPSEHQIENLVDLFGTGRYLEAADMSRAMTECYPQHAFGWKVLGAAYKQLGRISDALLPMQKAAALSANDAEAYSNLGCILYDLGRMAESEISLRRALQIRPDFAQAHNNLGNTLQEMGLLVDAEESYLRALQINSDYAEAHFNLANTFKKQGRLNDAVVSYRRSLQINPDNAAAHNNLGVTLMDIGRLTEAEASCRQALQIKPDFVDAYTNLGNILMDMGRAEEAETSYKHAIQLDPNCAGAHYNLGSSLKDMNRFAEAEASYRRALQINPDFFEAHSNLLFLLNYSSATPAALSFAEARRYGQQVSKKATARFADWSCSMQPERLRIGLVSGDFRNHPVSYFLESLLPRLGQSFDLYAYPTDNKPDELTGRIKPHFAAWHSLFGLSDEAAARLIHGDKLHILIDLSGHTRYNRLPMFAWKPAPVQVSWLGYFSTTGVAEIDYLIADPWVLPLAEEAYFTEKIRRLPETRLCFTPPAIDMDVMPLPALSNGYVTFGCFNNLSKLNDNVIKLWSNILVSVPNSRLFLKAKQLKTASVCRQTIARFAEHGIEKNRLILEGPESRAEYLVAYHRVDITLDPFPYTGGTTSVESLWMGVPVLTLAGERCLSRQGVGILMNAGLPEWIAADSDDYRARAISHANDLNALAKLRNQLRQQILVSPLFNSADFVRHFEAALRGMWCEWRDRQI